MNRKAIVIVALLAAAGPIACQDKPDPARVKKAAPAAKQVETSQPAAPETAGISDEAKKLFKGRCSVCHGMEGKGDGPGSAALDPKPRNYTDAEWQKTVTDEQLKAVITMGGAAVGKSPIMPASPDLQAKPEIVEDLVKIVRSFAKGD